MREYGFSLTRILRYKYVLCYLPLARYMLFFYSSESYISLGRPLAKLLPILYRYMLGKILIYMPILRRTM